MAAVRQLATRAGCTAAYIEHALTAAEADACSARAPPAVASRRMRSAAVAADLLRSTLSAPSYVGLRLPPQPWTPELLEMRARVAAAIDRPAKR